MREGYRRPIPATWWLQKRSYSLFMLREFTSVFVGGYAFFLLVLVSRAQDPASFAPFYEALMSPLSIVLHLLALAMVLYHTVTWLNLTPKVVIVWRGEQKLAPFVIAGAHYLLWLVTSGAVAWLVLR